MRYLLFATVLFAATTYALDVGDPQPGLEGYTIDDSADFLGPYLDIQDYINDGKVVVVTHWKQS